MKAAFPFLPCNKLFLYQLCDLVVVGGLFVVTLIVPFLFIHHTWFIGFALVPLEENAYQAFPNSKHLDSRDDQSVLKNLKTVSDKNFGILVPPGTAVKPYTSSQHSGTDVSIKDAYLEEAKACIRKAKTFAEAGNRKLAFKLYKHALALSPTYTEGLNDFGEFLEDENILQADLLYQRALSCDPTHTTALANRQRTAPLVLELDKKVFSEIDEKKKELYKYSSHHPSLRNAMKEFYYQHIYHTVAIEGNTLTLEEIRHIIDHRTGLAGKSIMEHNEVIGIAEALAYMNNTLLMKIGEITIDDIKSIHKRVMGFVDPMSAGEFRTKQVFVGGHIPPHPSDVEFLMQQFEDWLNSPEAMDLHPVEFAAIGHYRLVYIHPFLDGNGRTARLLMNFILMKNGFPPVSVEVTDRWEYYETLIAANAGDIRPFIRFIAHCTTRTLEDYLLAAELPYINMQYGSDSILHKSTEGNTAFISPVKAKDTVH